MLQSAIIILIQLGIGKCNYGTEIFKRISFLWGFHIVTMNENLWTLRFIGIGMPLQDCIFFLLKVKM